VSCSNQLTPGDTASRKPTTRCAVDSRSARIANSASTGAPSKPSGAAGKINKRRQQPLNGEKNTAI